MKPVFRKIMFPVLALILITVTTGLSVHKHYCNGIPVSRSATHQQDCSGDSDCCEEETVYVHLDNNFFAPARVSLPVVTEFSAILSFISPLAGMQTTPFKNKIHLFRQHPSLLPETGPPFTGTFLL